jgi:aspartate kinase
VGQGGLTDLSFTVPRGEAGRAREVLSGPATEMKVRELVVTDDIAKVSVVGVGMRSHTGVAARCFAALAAEGINIMMISTSEIKISCVIGAKYTELAVRTLHETFGLSKKPC